jgi:TonB family protein
MKVIKKMPCKVILFIFAMQLSACSAVNIATTACQSLTSSKGNVKLLKSHNPEYPAAALSAGIEGRVVMEFVVNPDGKVEQAKVLHSAGTLLDEARLKAILEWQFEPMLENGAPVSTTFNESFVFTLTPDR